MDLTSLITGIVSGAVGGNAAGLSLKDLSLGAIWNTLIGLVGGVAGIYIIQALNILEPMGRNVTLFSVLGHAVIGFVSGAVLTGIIGLIKNAAK